MGSVHLMSSLWIYYRTIHNFRTLPILATNVESVYRKLMFQFAKWYFLLLSKYMSEDSYDF
jgi:hypothetical protein